VLKPCHDYRLQGCPKRVLQNASPALALEAPILAPGLALWQGKEGIKVRNGDLFSPLDGLGGMHKHGINGASHIKPA
jgi:hypothetical protein